MKFKTSAIALAVAGSVAAPVAVQAGADEVYASARIGLWNQDTAGESEMDIRSFSSRFGARGETDLGNGMTGFGRYEWDVDLGEGGGLSVRHRYVGLKGDFGSVLIGQTNHSFYKTVVGPLDNPWWHSGYNMISYGAPNQTSSRADNAITYSGSFGAVGVNVTGYFDLDLTRDLANPPDTQQAIIDLNNAILANITNPGTFTAAEIAELTAATTASADSDAEDGLDGIELGVTIPIGDMTLGIAMQDIELNEEEVIGVALSGIAIGDASLGVSFMTQDEDDGFVIDLGIGNAYVHIESTSRDAADTDPMAITLGYTQSIGRKTTAYYEVYSLDADTGDSDDDVTRIMGVLKYDII